MKLGLILCQCCQLEILCNLSTTNQVVNIEFSTQNSVGQAERQDDEPDLKPRYESVQRAQQSGLEQKDREVEQTRYFFYLDQVFCEGNSKQLRCGQV